MRHHSAQPWHSIPGRTMLRRSKPVPTTTSSTTIILAGRQSSPDKGCIFLNDESRNTKIFVAGNVSSLSPTGSEDPWLNVTSYDLVAGKSIERRPAPLSFRSMQPFPAAPIVTQTAEEAYDSVIARVGPKIRDADDRRVIQSVEQRSGIRPQDRTRPLP